MGGGECPTTGKATEDAQVTREVKRLSKTSCSQKIIIEGKGGENLNKKSIWKLSQESRTPAEEWLSHGKMAGIKGSPKEKHKHLKKIVIPREGFQKLCRQILKLFITKHFTQKLVTREGGWQRENLPSSWA